MRVRRECVDIKSHLIYSQIYTQAATWIEGIQSDMLSTTNYPEASKTGVRHATQFAGLGFSESKANKVTLLL